MKAYELNRKKYDAVRKMDHNQMKNYIRGVYEDGFRNGKNIASADKPVLDLTGLEERLQGIRGVGGAKARIVAEAVAEFMEEKACGQSNDKGEEAIDDEHRTVEGVVKL